MTVIYNWYYHFWWLRLGMPQVFKITKMQCLCNISRIHWVMKLSFACEWIDMEIFYNLTVLFLMGLARHAQSTQVNLQYLCDILKKEFRNEVRDFTALIGSSIVFTVYYTSHVLPPVTLFLSYLEFISSQFFIWLNVRVRHEA